MEQENLHIEERIRAAIDAAVKAAVTEATKGRDIGPRNLVVCIDGTANQFGVKNSNVVELYHLLIKDENQITFYNSGIGTYAKPSWRSLAYWKQVFDHNIDLMIAWNFERIVIDAYQWLSENYRNGDKIFLFGFSRGAYQVRCLSAMIEMVGLIHRGNEAQVAFAYELYADTGMDSSGSAGSPTAQDLATHFKQTFSREVKVHFVGAWDTVSSVGIFRDKTLPGTTSGMKHVGFFRHALALDERRVKFLPEYTHEGSSLGNTPERVHDGTTAENRTLPKRESNPHTKEVWFAAGHR